MSTDPLFQLALEHHRAGRLREAAGLYQEILGCDPDHSDALHMLGLILHQSGQLKAAADLIRRAVELDPKRAQYICDLGLVLAAAGRVEQAIVLYRQAAALKPDYLQAHNNLGNALKRLGRLDEAIEALRNAVSLQPDYCELLSNLANALKERGDIDEAIELFRKAVALGGGPQIVSNLLFAMHFHPRVGPQELFDEHKKWNERFARPLMRKPLMFENDRSGDRRLRVGYVSCDFRDHTLGRFILPLLANHDHRAFEVFCYNAARREDEMTQRLRSYANTWRNVVSLSDEQLARQIRDDRIDILVDLSMHTDAARLLAFARKPAPVQVTYLAYAGTTGLNAIDYRFTDSFIDPPDQDDRWYSEQSIRLQSYWCYEPPAEALAVGPSPVQANGFITLGCFNHASKIGSASLEMWRELLSAVPRSRLILHSPRGSHRQRIAEFFGEAGVNSDRVEFVDRAPLSEYFQQYQRIDIALDPFPYTGGATTCDALWMGVPVVSLSGATAVSRGGASILSHAGLPELIASTPEDYVCIATALAGDVQRLSELRASLRDRMRQSPLCDAKSFARSVDVAFRTMWSKWCNKQE